MFLLFSRVMLFLFVMRALYFPTDFLYYDKQYSWSFKSRGWWAFDNFLQKEQARPKPIIKLDPKFFVSNNSHYLFLWHSLHKSFTFLQSLQLMPIQESEYLWLHFCPGANKLVSNSQHFLSLKILFSYWTF